MCSIFNNSSKFCCSTSRGDGTWTINGWKTSNAPHRTSTNGLKTGMGRPPMGPPPMHMVRRPLPPPMYRPMPIYRPYYYSYYYPSYYRTTYYSYYPTRYYSDVVTPVSTSTNAVIIRDDYAGINTAANVINAAANVASTIRYLTW